MVQESTVICVDNSEWMRNGDMSPNRLQCQQEAARVLIQYKLRSNPENAVGLISMSNNVNVLTSLTQEDRKLLPRLLQVEIQGSSKIMCAIKTSHLVLKNRSNRNHKTRIIVFIGSPLDNIEEDYNPGEFLRLAKKLKKENVKVDFVLFGEATSLKNQLILDFVGVLNGADGVGSSVVVVPGDAKLYETLLSSAICRNEDGTGGGEYDFGIDGDDDPELALALRVSLEEQRQRQRQEKASTNENKNNAVEQMDVDNVQASGETSSNNQNTQVENFNPANMTEEEQFQWALRMSMMNEDCKKAEKIKNVASSSNNNETSDAVAEGNKVDDEVLSLAGATASGTPVPTPMETDSNEKTDTNSSHLNALGQLIDNPDLLQQLVNQMPENKKTDDKKK